MYRISFKDSPVQGLSLCKRGIIMARKKSLKPIKNASTRQTKVAIYLRVSTSYQVDKDSLPMHRKDLIAYCSLILGTDNYEIFEDA